MQLATFIWGCKSDHRTETSIIKQYRFWVIMNYPGPGWKFSATEIPTLNSKFHHVVQGD